MVEVFAVDGRILATQACLQREVLSEGAAQGAVDAMHLLGIIEMGRRSGVKEMRSGASGAVVVSPLVGPVHATLVASLKPPAIVEGAQPVEFEVQCLVVVLGLALAEVVVVVLGSNIVIDLFLLALARHLAGAKGGIEGQLLILAVELLRV